MSIRADHFLLSGYLSTTDRQVADLFFTRSKTKALTR